MKTNTLPDKPSDLIELAINDLEKIERSKQYTVNMEDWHTPIYQHQDYNLQMNTCEVCLAGAVMAKTLKTPYGRGVSPANFEGLEGKLHALNLFRTGLINEGLASMCLPKISGEPFKVPEYCLNPEGFKTKMRQIAENLRSRGI